jgi:hypothetical protein
MELEPYVADLRNSLTAAAAVGDDNTQRSAAALAAALEPAVRLALVHALTDMAAEVTAQLAAQPAADVVSVDVRLDGRDVAIRAARSAFAGASPPEDHPTTNDSARTWADASGDLTRTTVRMFNELKGQAERAAASQGVSLNSFISRAVADSIRGAKAHRGEGRDHFRGKRSGTSSGGTNSGSTISGYVQG